MKLYTVVYRFAMLRAKSVLKKQLGTVRTKQLYAASNQFFPQIVQKTPDIGDSVFHFNYAFAPAYIAWYKAASQTELSADETKGLLWLMNEKVISAVPPVFCKWYGSKYLTDFRKNAPLQAAKTKAGTLHPYDFAIDYISQDNTHFGIDITRCGMRTLAADFDAMGIFPTVCRVDYMIGHILHSGFERTKTLADGDDCCDCHYIIGGTCAWDAEKGSGGMK